MEKEKKRAWDAVIKTACMQNCDIIAAAAFTREYFVALLPRGESNFTSRSPWVPLESFAVVPAFSHVPKTYQYSADVFFARAQYLGLSTFARNLG